MTRFIKREGLNRLNGLKRTVAIDKLEGTRWKGTARRRWMDSVPNTMTEFTRSYETWTGTYNITEKDGKAISYGR